MLGENGGGGMNAYAGTAQDYISRLSAVLTALDRAQVDHAVRHQRYA